MVKQSINSILPEPFNMIKIPEGSVTVKDKTEIISAFEIAKYPVTNAQFARFVDAKGYENKAWWTDAGWEAREQEWDADTNRWKLSKKPWTAPRFRQDDKWNGDNQPVVGVSWYEAVAFCLWLSEMTGDAITLPTEQQWQRAAQGDDGRAYPWGNDWSFTRARCNCSVYPCSNDATTSVTHYEGQLKGDSPYGVVDMSGNVWEWCRTGFQTGTQDVNAKDTRVLRGGSWNDNAADDFCCESRTHETPDYSPCDVGFRFVRTL
jgi:formylglycine-generating enzyme required for sulfatase activity